MLRRAEDQSQCVLFVPLVLAQEDSFEDCSTDALDNFFPKDVPHALLAAASQIDLAYSVAVDRSFRLYDPCETAGQRFGGCLIRVWSCGSDEFSVAAIRALHLRHGLGFDRILWLLKRSQGVLDSNESSSVIGPISTIPIGR